MTRIAVIGAGIAGLAAARELASAGLQPVVFDKGRGPGGRTSTRRAPPFAFDHGAQYFTVRDAHFAHVVQSWWAEGVAAPWNGRIVALEHARARELDDATLRFVGVPGMNALASRMAKELDVRCNTRVARADFSAQGWRLAGDDGASLGEFDRLVATLPHPQALELFGANSAFAPRTARSVVHPCWAVLLGAAQRLELDFDGAFCADSALSWIARDSSKPGRPPHEAWVLHATPEWTRAHLEAPREHVLELLLAEFWRITGLREQHLEHRDAHRWRYALPAPVDGPVEATWVDVERRLALAGDACVGGRIEGAFLSGRAAARAILTGL